MLLYFVFVVLDVKGTKRKILKDKGVHSIHSNLERVPLFLFLETIELNQK